MQISQSGKIKNMVRKMGTETLEEVDLMNHWL